MHANQSVVALCRVTAMGGKWTFAAVRNLKPINRDRTSIESKWWRQPVVPPLLLWALRWPWIYGNERQLRADNRRFQYRTMEHRDAGGGAVHSIAIGQLLNQPAWSLVSNL